MSNHRELHVIAGGSAAGVVKQALDLSWNELVIYDDLLSCGPLFTLRNLDEWQKLRQNYLSSLYPFDFSVEPSHRDLLSCLEEVRAADHVTVWIGTGLADQLFLAWVTQLFRLLNVDLRKIGVIQFSFDPNDRYEILGVGMLNEDQVRAHPEPFILDEGAIESLDRAWSAVTVSSPNLLLEFLAGNPGPLQFLQRSMQWLITRFPDFERGLSLWDFELLKQVSEKGPAVAKVIGFAIIRLIDSLDCVGDAYLFARLKGLGESSLRKPLVTLNGSLTEIRETEVILTETGKAVLDGTVNSVLLNGVDDWVCGIHLDSAQGMVWFQRNGVLVDSLPSMG